MPTASAPSPSKVTAAQSTLTPAKVRPFSSKVMVQKTGRELFSFTASKAAFSSSRSVMVSSTTKSAPAAAPSVTICL